MEKNKRGERWRVQGRNMLENFFEFYALLATSFSLTIRHAQQRGARCSAREFITVLTALTIHLFKVKKLFVPFLRVSQRAFCPKRFFILFSFIFSYLENLFVLFYLSFYFILALASVAIRSGHVCH